jgi:hypothetical protein
MDAPINVWNEVRVTSDGISISLFSESAGGPAVVEDELRFTFDELQELSPSEPISLRLSEETGDALLDEQRNPANVSKIREADSLEEAGEHLPENPSTDELLAYMGLDDMSDVEDMAEENQSPNLPPVGSVVEDGNPPAWSEDNELVVVGHPDESAGEYVVEERPHWSHRQDETVSIVNPSCDDDDPVIEVIYRSEFDDPNAADSEDIYAFPLSRIEW